MIPVGTLLFVGAGLLGATTMKDLALALLVGMITGVYSSVFVAVPILSILKEREPRYQNVREKVARDARRSTGTTTREVATAGSAPSGAAVPPGPSAATLAARKRAGSKKRKRRR
jgi:preprotein translocase subunit SecF